ncbi:hypothetical protein HYN56_02205 [Flavobacterium crocinum]|uniref:Endonuclease GajA/Old nuclease/RecF-like AAA domain-containing protein n=1 Tax=Flavobacterium crocinum TaxID=2183896 RepID=A0A2S1YGB4_9FLAO|nr:AAA family ATPase [Flavobacterium crocinum]AWK03094.1 hypothetical protein HYN56_02205 [Flavobacterium crocinum]
MKISKLHIDQFRHLENLDFDFTYPEDFHIEEKRGKPLDKICFIGQSATGKTGLLELIYEYSKNILDIEVVNGNSLFRIKSIIRDKGEVVFLIKNEIFHLRNNEIYFKGRSYKDDNNTGGSVTSLIPRKETNTPSYFKASLISDKNIEIFEKNPIEIFEKYADLPSIKFENFVESNDYTKLFDDNVRPEMWLLLLQEILEYRKKLNQKLSELVNKGLLSNTEKLTIEYKKWQKENPNKLESFANKFNPLLEKLNLEVDLVNTEYSIPILNKKTEETIPIQNTSTGTKGLLLTFLPLFKLDTKNSIILIDEPERSLYPDMQMELIDHYKNLAPEAQFIVATHSPFIAASFEPEERFILYFDNEGKVAVRRGISPIGDDPNDMLFNDFGVNYYNDDVQEKFKEYLSLLDKVKSENNKELKKKYLLEASKLGNQYNFILDEKNKERLQ